MKSHPPDKAIILKGDLCAYCGVTLAPETRQREHVIGRKFTPLGALEKNWNLQVQSCATCNNAKADLENDISAITQGLSFDLLTPKQREKLYHKAERSFSRRTKRPVTNSTESSNISARFGAASMEFGLSAPPQIDRPRAFQLAWYHVQGFFHWITYNPANQRGHTWVGTFMPIEQAARSDWGNPYFIGFSTATKDWTPRVHAVTADGFFKLSLKRDGKNELWSFAVEWNQSLRVIGLLGQPDLGHAFHAQIPKNQLSILPQSDGTVRYRQEVPLPPFQDDLFHVADNLGPDTFSA